MSDFWYRDGLPPYEDWQGRLWTIDGVCLNPKPEPEIVPHIDLRVLVFAEAEAYWRHATLGEWPPDDDGSLRVRR